MSQAGLRSGWLWLYFGESLYSALRAVADVEEIDTGGQLINREHVVHVVELIGAHIMTEQIGELGGIRPVGHIQVINIDVGRCGIRIHGHCQAV